MTLPSVSCSEKPITAVINRRGRDDPFGDAGAREQRDRRDHDRDHLISQIAQACVAVITAVIGFSLPGHARQRHGGVALQMEGRSRWRWIRVEPHEGRVKEIRWRQTSTRPGTGTRSSFEQRAHAKPGDPARPSRVDASPAPPVVYFNVDFRYPPTA